MATKTKSKKTYKYDEDLFKDSTMTFGEHLEELRLCLFKALVGLILAFVLTLIPPVNLAGRAVDYLKRPLEEALQGFYIEQSVERELDRLAAMGLTHENREVLAQAIREDRMTPAPMFIDATALLGDLRERYPTVASNFELPPIIASDLLDPIGFCKSVLAEQAGEGSSPGKRVWSLMGPEDQALVKRIAAFQEEKQLTGADRRALAEALAKIASDKAFFREEDYASIASSEILDVVLSTEHKHKHARYETALAAGYERGSPQFNRLMLAAAWPDAIAGGPRLRSLLPVLAWRSVEDDHRASIKSLSAHEMFMIFIKAALVVSIVIASPWIFYQIWSFVAAGLYPHEKRYVYVYGPISLTLFVAGCLLAFFFAFEPLLGFLLWFNGQMSVDPDIRISEWFGFAIFLPLGFGVSFQLPLVMLFLERIGVVTIDTYKSRWRGAILIICIAAMLLTPSGDPYSMLLMAVPLCILYAGGILLCKYMPKGRNPFAEED